MLKPILLYYFKKILCIIVLCLLFLNFKIVKGSSLSNLPTLILTQEKLNYLNEPSNNLEFELLLKVSLLSADYFRNTPIKKLKGANNKYRYIGESLPSLGLAYLITNEPKYLESSISIIQQLLAVNEWSGDDNLGRSSWVMGCSLLYNWLYDDLPVNLRESLKKRLLKEGKIIKETASKHRALSNHLLIETSAIGMIGLALKKETLEAEILLNQAKEWSAYIIKHAPKDGSWGEGVQYWEYGLSYFLQFIEASKTSGYYNFYKDYNWLRETGYFPIYFSLPKQYKEVLNFSDCSIKRKLPAFLLYLPAREYDNGYFQDFGNKVLSKNPTKYSWMNLLSYDSSVPVIDIYKLSTFKHFKDNGYVTMRSGWGANETIIGFRCGPAAGHFNQTHKDRIKKQGFGPGHGHPDINSFMIFSKDEWLAIDPGYTHLKETRNHNTIVSNGIGQSGSGKKWLDYMTFEARNPAPKIIKSESNNSYDYVIGDAGAIYEERSAIKKFQRHLIFLKPNIIVVYDKIETTKPSSIDWFLNAKSPIDKNKTNKSYVVKGNNVQLLVQPVNGDLLEGIISERKLRASDVNKTKGEEYGTMNTLTLKYKERSIFKNMVVMSLQSKKADTVSVESNSEGVKICQIKKCWNLKFSNTSNEFIITN